MNDPAIQRRWLVALLIVYAALAFLTYATGLANELMPGQELPPEMTRWPGWVFGLANAGIVLVVYGLMGLVGLYIARRLGLPGVIRLGAGCRRLFWAPLGLGVVVGIVMAAADAAFAAVGTGRDGLLHPAFPMSLIASASAGIGEEIAFRLFVMSLWAGLLNLVLGPLGKRRWALWGGNGLAALAFAAAHLPAVMFMLGAETLAAVPPLLMAEVFLLNGIVGVVAGERYARDGLVAAAGVHFWADVIWHVLWPPLAGLLLAG